MPEQDDLPFLLRTAALIAGLRYGSVSEADRADLEAWLAASEANRALFDELTAENFLDSALDEVDPIALRASAAKVYQRLGMNRAGVTPNRRVAVIRIGRWAAAAAIGGLIVWGAYSVIRGRHQELPTVAQAPGIKNDLPAPVGSHTTLTLANGNTIAIDSAVGGVFATQGSVQVQKTGKGALAYVANGGSPAQAVEYNTLVTARGGQATVVLADGTKVWLNAESSLKYPTAFAGGNRDVELTGEGYFEVEHDGRHPFRVHAGKAMIEDLGTRFDVNAYSDEPSMRTALFEGSVRVAGTELVPGQEEIITSAGQRSVQSGFDQDEVLGWKNGIFLFDQAGIETVMRQVMRWYDVEVSYAGKIPSGHYSGTVDRKANISQILKILEVSGIRLQFDGRKIVILPD